MGRVGRAGREGVAITLAEPREHRMLKTIEQVTKHKITVEKIPTVADLRERRLDLTRAALRESLLGDDLDGFRVVVESLAEEFDVMEVALAAVNLAHAAIGGPDDEEDIPDVVVSAPPKGQGDRDGRPNRKPTGHGGGWARDNSALCQPRARSGSAAAGPRRGHHRRDQPQRKNIGAIEISGRFSLVDVPEGSADEVIKALHSTKIRGRKATVRRERF